MCWRYEDNYGRCFDHIEWENDSETIRGVLEGQFNVKVNDSRRFIELFYEMLSILHEQKVIEPKAMEKDETRD